MSIASLDNLSKNLALMSYHDKEELDSLYNVNKVFRELVIKQYKDECKKADFIPKSLPADVNYKDFFLDRFPNRIDANFIREKIGKVDDVPPVPLKFIERAQPGFNLVLIPEYITIEVDENSSLELDEAFALDDKKARLIENQNSPLLGTAREIKVPLTLNNIIFLFQKKIPEFEGISYAWPNILDQHGDVGVGPSHWSYQKEKVIGLGESYQQQVNLATGEGLEIVPLTDRILFHLLSYMKTGQFPQEDYVERTSTITISDQGNSWQSAIWWPASGPSFRLCLYLYYYAHDDVGAVAGVPAGSSPAIGH